METVIEARGLSKKLDGKNIIESISLEIPKGQCFGLIGPKGAGKSTFLKMLYGRAASTGGELYLLGLNTKQYKSRIKAKIGVVPEENQLDRDFSVLDNLLVFADFMGFKANKAKMKARELLRYVHLEDFESHYVEALTLEQKRRLAFARALINDPEVLFVDEPTRGLLDGAKEKIWELVKEQQSKGLTIVLCSQDVDETQKLCDRVLILERGKVLACDDPESLITQHIGASVVEFYVDSSEVEYYLGKIKNKYAYQVLAHRVRVYLGWGESYEEAISLVSSKNVNVRNATLEDVFLKLAGRELLGEGS